MSFYPSSGPPALLQSPGPSPGPFINRRNSRLLGRRPLASPAPGGALGGDKRHCALGGHGLGGVAPRGLDSPITFSPKNRCLQGHHIPITKMDSPTTLTLNGPSQGNLLSPRDSPISLLLVLNALHATPLMEAFKDISLPIIAALSFPKARIPLKRLPTQTKVSSIISGP